MEIVGADPLLVEALSRAAESPKAKRVEVVMYERNTQQTPQVLGNTYPTRDCEKYNSDGTSKPYDF